MIKETRKFDYRIFQKRMKEITKAANKHLSQAIKKASEIIVK